MAWHGCFEQQASQQASQPATGLVLLLLIQVGMSGNSNSAPLHVTILQTSHWSVDTNCHVAKENISSLVNHHGRHYARIISGTCLPNPQRHKGDKGDDSNLPILFLYMPFQCGRVDGKEIDT